MKRMNEVFELPLVVEFVGGNEFHVKNEARHTPAILASSVDESYYAAHAINNVDKLADALEALIPYCFGGNEEAMNAWAEAKDALAAYRGAL